MTIQTPPTRRATIRTNLILTQTAQWEIPTSLLVLACNENLTDKRL
jgi:hypothetical protein